MENKTVDAPKSPANTSSSAPDSSSSVFSVFASYPPPPPFNSTSIPHLPTYLPPLPNSIYSNKSFEKLRWEDYKQNRKDSSIPVPLSSTTNSSMNTQGGGSGEGRNATSSSSFSSLSSSPSSSNNNRGNSNGSDPLYTAFWMFSDTHGEDAARMYFGVHCPPVGSVRPSKLGVKSSLSLWLIGVDEPTTESSSQATIEWLQGQKQKYEKRKSSVPIFTFETPSPSLTPPFTFTNSPQSTSQPSASNSDSAKTSSTFNFGSPTPLSSSTPQTKTAPTTPSTVPLVSPFNLKSNSASDSLSFDNASSSPTLVSATNSEGSAKWDFSFGSPSSSLSTPTPASLFVDTRRPFGQNDTTAPVPANQPQQPVKPLRITAAVTVGLNSNPTNNGIDALDKTAVKVKGGNKIETEKNKKKTPAILLMCDNCGIEESAGITIRECECRIGSQYCSSICQASSYPLHKLACKAARKEMKRIENKTCSFCKNSDAGIVKTVCAGCESKRNCSKNCQRAHWRDGHKEECMAWRKKLKV